MTHRYSRTTLGQKHCVGAQSEKIDFTRKKNTCQVSTSWRKLWVVIKDEKGYHLCTYESSSGEIPVIFNANFQLEKAVGILVGLWGILLAVSLLFFAYSKEAINLLICIFILWLSLTWIFRHRDFTGWGKSRWLVLVQLLLSNFIVNLGLSLWN